jgi:hypothetical protein
LNVIFLHLNFSFRASSNYIAENIGAIGFIRVVDLDLLDDSVKAIKIEGRTITDRDYPLK